MATIELANNWECYTDFDKEKWDNVLLTNKGFMDSVVLNLKYPYRTGEYRVTWRLKNIKFKTDVELESIPFIAYKKDSTNNLYFLSCDVYSDDNMEVLFNKENADLTRYRWYQQEVDSIYYDVADTPQFSIVDGDYLADTWIGVTVSQWDGESAGYPFYIDTSLPIFEIDDTFDYTTSRNAISEFQKIRSLNILNEPGVVRIVNMKEEDIEKEYYIYNEYKHGTASLLEGFIPDTGAMLFRKYETIKAKGGYLALVRQDDNSYSIVNNGATIIGSYYGNHTQYDLQPYPNVIQQTTGFYNYWDGFTIGSINVASLLDTNMDIYGNVNDYQDVIDGRKKPEDVAENYKKKDKGDGKENNTGNKEKETTLGKPNFETFFVNQYILTLNEARSLADALFLADATQIALIKEAISTFFANPIEAIADITYYPFNVANYVTSLTNEVTIGRWQSGVNGKKIFKREATIDVGSIYFKETYGNFRDYQTKITIYLPYIGVHTLETSKYLNHTIRIKYGVDLFTHQCTAFIFADDILIDYFSGNMGVTMPITATNFSQYASGFIDYAKGSVGNVSQGSLAGQVGSIEGLWKNVPENMRETKGSFSPSIGCYAPQYVRICFESLVSDDNETYTNSLRGIPSNATGSISSFSGFLSVSDVNLVCSNATASEKYEIRALLDSGIYIRE